jgi:hypothetical protein
MLETQKVNTGIHNHNFSFRSKVLLGGLWHTEYDNLEQNLAGFYNVYKTVPRDREDKELVLASPHPYDLKGYRGFYFGQGSLYSFKYGRFHESTPAGLTVTVMRKTKVEPLIDAWVLCKVYEKPDNDFNKYQYSPEVLWPIIEDVFNKIKEIDTTYI